MNDVLLNKKESIEKCIRQIRVYYKQNNNLAFEEDFLKQDAIAINLQRICELALDMANYIIKVKKIGLPKESKESFVLLKHNKFVPDNLADNLTKMVGFRNVLIHEYNKLDLSIMKDVIENHLDEIIEYTNCLLDLE